MRKLTVEMTNKQMEDFVKSRVNPALQKGYYSTILDHRNDSLQNKKLRDTFIFFRSSSKPSALEGQDIDYLSLDEYDRVSPAAETSGMQSLKSSPLKIVRRWSTPTVPMFGVHEKYEQSDQHVYLHKCDACNHWQQLDYVENIECVDEKGIDELAKTVKEGTFRFVCSKCNAGLDRWHNGMWVKFRIAHLISNG